MRSTSLLLVLSLCFVFVFAFAACSQLAQAQTLTTLHSFSGGNDGATPSSLTVEGAAFYGTTQYGGHYGPDECPSGCGTVFQLAPWGSRWLLTPIYTFQGVSSTGFHPMDRPILGPNGELYGTTSDIAVRSGGDGRVLRLRPHPTIPSSVL